MPFFTCIKLVLHVLACARATSRIKWIRMLTGCDVTSKVEKKTATLNSEPQQYLESFGEMNDPSLESFEKAEKYLVRVLQKNSKSTNFNELKNGFLQ